MSHFVDASQLAEACYELDLPTAQRDLEKACDDAARAIAAKLKIDITQDAATEPGFGGLCVGFGPRRKGQKCPDALIHFDRSSAWHEDTRAAEREKKGERR